MATDITVNLTPAIALTATIQGTGATGLQGTVATASTAETIAGTLTTKAVTPAGLAALGPVLSVVAGTGMTVAGTANDPTVAVNFASDATTITGTLTTTAVTPAGLKTALPYLNVKAHGATGDGTTNDRVAIQAAIDAANAYDGTVFFPPGVYRADGLILKSGVTLLGPQGHHGRAWSVPAIGAATIQAPSTPTTTWIIDTEAGAVATAIVGMNIVGNAATGGGVRLNSGDYHRVAQVNIYNTAYEGLKIVAGLGDRIEDLMIINANLARPLAAQSGALWVGGTDHMITRLEIAGTPGAAPQPVSTNAYCAAIYVPGNVCSFSHCIGELGDVGFYVSGSGNLFTCCRSDLNYGHGWNVSGSYNQFSSCLSLSNSQATNNTYDGWVVGGNGNTFSACVSRTTGGVTNKCRYGVNDIGTSLTPENGNDYYGMKLIDTQTAQWNVATSFGNAPVHSNHAPNSTVNLTTQSVAGTGLLNLSGYTAATTMTNFTGGTQGQTLAVLGNANVTLQHGTSIYTSTGANKLLAGNKIYRFTLLGAIWYEDA